MQMFLNTVLEKMVDIYHHLLPALRKFKSCYSVLIAAFVPSAFYSKISLHFVSIDKKVDEVFELLCFRIQGRGYSIVEPMIVELTL